MLRQIFNSVEDYIFLLLILSNTFFLIYSLFLSQKIKQLYNEIFSVRRDISQKNNILEHTLSTLTQDLPILSDSSFQKNNVLFSVEKLIGNFSQNLHQKLQTIFESQQSIWNEKFSILLEILGYEEKDLTKITENHFKESWETMESIKEKSLDLFKEIQEDSMFYRLQSLWLLSNSCILQENYLEAFRYSIASIKLYKDFLPSSPLSKKITWGIADNLISSTQQLSYDQQSVILKQFFTNSEEILKIFENLHNFDNNSLSLKEIKLWAYKQKIKPTVISKTN